MFKSKWWSFTSVTVLSCIDEFFSVDATNLSLLLNFHQEISGDKIPVGATFLNHVDTFLTMLNPSPPPFHENKIPRNSFVMIYNNRRDQNFKLPTPSVYVVCERRQSIYIIVTNDLGRQQKLVPPAPRSQKNLGLSYKFFCLPPPPPLTPHPLHTFPLLSPSSLTPHLHPSLQSS